MSSDLKLATRWPTSKVRRCLRRRDRAGLLQFLRQRHEERFFKPIRLLKKAPANIQGYGFAMMAICALLVETIQSYRDGLPTTYGSELNRLKRMTRVPLPYRIPSSLEINGKKTFQRFFTVNAELFPGLGGARFYKNIRNGILHQGQTKAGWVLRKWGPDDCSAKGKVIFRDNFADQLERAFGEYIAQLQKRSWDHKLWTHAARKIWWLARLSQ